MDLAAAAAYLEVGEDDVLELLQNKDIQGKKIGSKWRITRDAIDRYLNSNE
jgi:excisionase family DNA binding protein